MLQIEFLNNLPIIFSKYFIAHAVHTNTHQYAHNYIMLMHMMYTQTHSYLHTIT